MSLHSSNWDDLPLVLTVDEVAEILKLNANAVEALCRSGELRAARLGADWRIERSALIARFGAADDVDPCEDVQSTLTLAALMSCIPEGITIAGAPDVAIRMVSEYARRLTGRPTQAIEGIPLPGRAKALDLYAADGVTRARWEDLPLTRATLHGEVVADEEWVLGRPTGERVPVLCNAGPIRDPEGHVVGGVLAFRDISALKKVERERERLLVEVQAQAAALRDANRLLQEQAEELRIQEDELRVQNEELAQTTVQLEAALLEQGRAHALYRAVLENATAGIAVFEGRGLRLKVANAAYRQSLDGRYRAENLTGYTLQELMPQAEGSGLLPRIRRVAASRQSHFDPEFRYPGFARGTTYWRYSLVPLPDDGPVPDVMILMTDITDEVMAREAAEAVRAQIQGLANQLAAERRFLATIMNAIPVAITYVDEGLIYRQCNEAAAQDFGLPAAQVVGRHLREVIPGNPHLWEAVGEVLRTGEPSPLSTITVRWAHRPEQGPRHYSISYLPDKDETGRVRGVIAEGQDITELVEARRVLEEYGALLEQRVRERTAELEAIIASMPDAVYIGDETGITRCNQTALDFLGCTSLQDLQDRIPVLSEKLHNRYAETGERIRPEDEVFARALMGEAGSVELISRNLQTGQDIIVRSAAHPIMLGGQVIGAVAVNTDVTERKRAEQELRASRAQLQVLARRLMEAQETERRAIALELHDETAQIVTALSLGLFSLARHREVTPTVASRLEQYGQMTSTLMGELHKLIENLRPASLQRGGLLPAITHYVETLRKEYGLKVEVSADGLDGPRLPDDIEIAMFRLVQEALINIVRHAHASSVLVTVEQRAEALSAVIRDDGAGFDPVEAARRGRLGLLGMRERAEMFGGGITIESAPGRGATVSVEIPLGASRSAS